ARPSGKGSNGGSERRSDQTMTESNSGSKPGAPHVAQLLRLSSQRMHLAMDGHRQSLERWVGFLRRSRRPWRWHPRQDSSRPPLFPEAVCGTVTKMPTYYLGAKEAQVVGQA